MRLDWDAGKATSNRRKHGAAFDEAITAFDDPYALLAPDPIHSTPREQRTWLIGKGDPGVLVVEFTIRGGEVVRLISARRANRRERKRYEESKELPV